MKRALRVNLSIPFDDLLFKGTDLTAEALLESVGARRKHGVDLTTRPTDGE